MFTCNLIYCRGEKDTAVDNSLIDSFVSIMEGSENTGNDYNLKDVLKDNYQSIALLASPDITSAPDEPISGCKSVVSSLTENFVVSESAGASGKSSDVWPMISSDARAMLRATNVNGSTIVTNLPSSMPQGVNSAACQNKVYPAFQRKFDINGVHLHEGRRPEHNDMKVIIDVVFNEMKGAYANSF